MSVLLENLRKPSIFDEGAGINGKDNLVGGIFLFYVTNAKFERIVELSDIQYAQVLRSITQSIGSRIIYQSKDKTANRHQIPRNRLNIQMICSK